MKVISKKLVVGILSLVFLLALVSATPVEAKTPLRWEYNAGYTFEPEWTGEILTDDVTSGVITLDVIEWVNLPDIQKSEGIWRIEWDDGEYIEGTYHGKSSWISGDYVMNGKVIGTSASWTHLNERNIHIMGTIDFSVYLTSGIFQIN